MRFKTLALATGVATLAASPIVAQAAGAARSAAPVDGENALAHEGSMTQLIVLGLVAAAIIVGISVTDDEPSSP